MRKKAVNLMLKKGILGLELALSDDWIRATGSPL